MEMFEPYLEAIRKYLLIGPTIFPRRYVLRIALIFASVVYVAANVALAITRSHDTSWVLQVVFSWPALLDVPAAWITIVFAVL